MRLEPLTRRRFEGGGQRVHVRELDELPRGRGRSVGALPFEDDGRARRGAPVREARDESLGSERRERRAEIAVGHDAVRHGRQRLRRRLHHRHRARQAVAHRGRAQPARGVGVELAFERRVAGGDPHDFAVGDGRGAGERHERKNECDGSASRVPASRPQAPCGFSTTR